MIRYMVGDATQPDGDGKKIIIHIVNNISAWGKGFVLAVSKRWSEPEERYKKLCKFYQDKCLELLGHVQFVYINQDLIIGNMFAQNGIISQKNPHPLDYVALEQCLIKVKGFAKKYGCEVVGCRFGSGLAGGSWTEIEKIILSIMPDVDVTIYDLK